MSTIHINTTGTNQIRQFLADNHKLGGDHFDDAMLSAWAADVERNYSEQGCAEFEIRGADSVSGDPVICRISPDGYTVEPTEISISVDHLRGEIAPLYRRYQGQTEAQLAHIEMTEDGLVSVGVSGEIGNAVPAHVWHGRTLRWGVPATVNGAALADLLASAEAINLLERVHLGHSVEWDGNNHVGRLDDNAEEAIAEFQALLDLAMQHSDDEGGVWGARDWMDGAGLLAWWSGKPLDEAVDYVEEAAASEGVHLDGDIEEELLDWAASCIHHPTEYAPTLDVYHLRALLDDGRIDEAEAAEYAEDHGIEVNV